MIDGDNRGERCLAYPHAPSSVLRTHFRSRWLHKCGWSAVSSSHICREKHTGIAAWSHTNKGLETWGDVTLRYGSTLLQPRIAHAKFCWWTLDCANQNQ